jgi:hypothetical protein
VVVTVINIGKLVPIMSKESIKRYKSIFDALMSFVDGLGERVEYGKEKLYSQEELNRVCQMMLFG